MARSRRRRRSEPTTRNRKPPNPGLKRRDRRSIVEEPLFPRQAADQGFGPPPSFYAYFPSAFFQNARPFSVSRSASSHRILAIPAFDIMSGGGSFFHVA